MPKLLLTPLLIVAAACAIAVAAAFSAKACSRALSNPRTLMSHGCQLTIWQSAGRLWAEPAFCVPVPAAPDAFYSDAGSPALLWDPIGSYYYVNVPVMLANRTLLDEAVRQIVGEDGSATGQYLRVESVTITAAASDAAAKFLASDFVWSESDPVGLLKLKCSGIDCSVLIQLIKEGLWELVELPSVTVGLLDLCGRPMRPAISDSRPVTFQGSNYRSLRGLALSGGQTDCRNNFTALSAFTAVIGAANCRLRLHRSLSASGGGADTFYLEPLICYAGGARLWRSVNTRRRYVLLDIRLRDDEALAAAKAWLKDDQLTGGAEPNVTFMQLVDPRMKTRQWPAAGQEPQLLISANESALLLRVACGSTDECSRLLSAVQSDPLVVLSRISWRPKFQADACRIEAPGSRLSLPLTKPRPRTSAASPASQAGPACGGSRVPGGCQFVRLDDGRIFLVAQQRVSPGVSFGRNWDDYEEGFGDRRNFWIGLRSMSAVTQPNGSLLRIEARLWNGSLLFAEYSGVRLLGPRYNLTYDSYLNRQSNTGPDDLLSRSRNHQFSTQYNLSQPVQVYYNRYGGYRGYGPRGTYRYTRNLESLGSAGWWWYGEALRGTVDFNPNGIFHYSDALSPNSPYGNKSGQLVPSYSLIGLNRTLPSGCAGPSASKSWTLLKEVRLLIEI